MAKHLHNNGNIAIATAAKSKEVRTTMAMVPLQ
jgi:hypothetical protein